MCALRFSTKLFYQEVDCKTMRNNDLFTDICAIAFVLFVIGGAITAVASLYGFFIGVALYVIRTIAGF